MIVKTNVICIKPNKGSMGANASKNESTTSSTTYGTIGSGLIVANTIEGNINRDVNNLASEEKTIINHNLNANLQIDTRVLSTAGREEIKMDVLKSEALTTKVVKKTMQAGANANLDWKYAYNFAKEIGRLNTLDDIQQQVRLTNNNSLIKEEAYDKIASDRLGEELGSKVEVRSEMYDKIDGNTKVEDVEKARGESIGKEMDKAMGEWNYGKQDSQNMLKNNAQWLSQANNILYGNGGLTQSNINGYWNFKQNVSSSNIMFDNKIKSDVATKYGNGKYAGGKINIDGILDGAIDVASKNLASSLESSKFEYNEEESTYYSKLGKEKLGKTETWTTLNTAVSVFNAQIDYTVNNYLQPSFDKKLISDVNGTLVKIINDDILQYDNYRTPLDENGKTECKNNCGHYGANRNRGGEKGPHYGTDINATTGQIVLAPYDGYIVAMGKYDSKSTGEKGKLNMIMLNFDESVWQNAGDLPDIQKQLNLSYISNNYIDNNAKNGVTIREELFNKNKIFVKAGQPIAYVQDITKGYSDTTNHVHSQLYFGGEWIKDDPLDDIRDSYKYLNYGNMASSSQNPYKPLQSSAQQINSIVPIFNSNVKK